jgi:hypothetical protein
MTDYYDTEELGSDAVLWSEIAIRASHLDRPDRVIERADALVAAYRERFMVLAETREVQVLVFPNGGSDA